MASKLSPREEEVVELSTQGLTNEAIAASLGVSLGTINTYWLRIRLKVGGLGRTDTVVRIIRERAAKALREANTERADIAALIAEKERLVLEHRAAIALLNMAMAEIKSTVWATDRDLCIQIIANGEFPTSHFGVTWEAGRTVYEVFNTSDPDDPGIRCHQEALEGEACSVRLEGEFSSIALRTMPLRDESGEILGCISILHALSGGGSEI